MASVKKKKTRARAAMQDVRTSVGKCWTNMLISHNDRKNDALFYWISFMLFLLTLFSSVIGSLAITLAESQLALVGIPIFIGCVGLSLHWFQCTSARYWSPLPHNLDNAHINLENESENIIDTF